MSLFKLYYAPGACSLAAHIVLEEIGARFELSRVDLSANEQNSAQYLRVNPKARVPASGESISTKLSAQFIRTHVTIGLRKIAQHAADQRIELFREQAHIIAALEQTG